MHNCYTYWYIATYMGMKQRYIVKKPILIHISNIVGTIGVGEGGSRILKRVRSLPSACHILKAIGTAGRKGSGL